jgi:hypothetical protein
MTRGGFVEESGLKNPQEKPIPQGCSEFVPTYGLRAIQKSSE